MKEFKMFVPGIARTAGSHSTYQGRIVHAGKHTRKWMDTIAWFALKEFGRPCLLEGAIFLNVVIYLPRPKGDFSKGKNAGKLKPSAPKDHIKHPDLDKLVRAIQDALTKIIWRDDSQITMLHALKYYENTLKPPGIEIYIKEF